MYYRLAGNSLQQARERAKERRDALVLKKVDNPQELR